MQSDQNNGSGSSCAGQRGEGNKQRQTQPTSGTKPHLSPRPPHTQPVPTPPPAGPPSVLGLRRGRCLHSRVPARPTSRAGSGLSAPEAKSGQVGVLESSPAFPGRVRRASARRGERLLRGASRLLQPGVSLRSRGPRSGRAGVGGTGQRRPRADGLRAWGFELRRKAQASATAGGGRVTRSREGADGR